MKWSDKSNPFRRMEQRKTVFITVVYIITMFFLMSHKWQKKKRKEIRRNFSLTMQCFIDTLLDRYMSTVSKRSLETHHNVVRRIDWFAPSFFTKSSGSYCASQFAIYANFRDVRHNYWHAIYRQVYIFSIKYWRKIVF